jgi:hypothetical protein
MCKANIFILCNYIYVQHEEFGSSSRQSVWVHFGHYSHNISNFKMCRPEHYWRDIVYRNAHLVYQSWYRMDFTNCIKVCNVLSINMPMCKTGPSLLWPGSAVQTGVDLYEENDHVVKYLCDTLIPFHGALLL